MSSLNFDAKDVARTKIGTFSFDGQPIINAQSNISRCLFNEVVENPFIPPGTKILIRLWKRDPFNAIFELPQIEDTDYWTEVPSALARPIMKIEISELNILYESKILESQATATEARTTPYYADIPRLHLQGVAGGQMYTRNMVAIPVGCRYVVLAWVFQQQMFYNATSLKNLSCRLRFPPHSIKLRVSLTNHALPLLFKDGLTNLGTSDSYSSTSCHAYWKYLVQHNLYHKSKEHLFPEPAGSFSYEQCLIIPTHHLTISKETELAVELSYSDALSVGKYYLWSATVQQYKFNYQVGAPMTSQVVV
jgi:hypothetical protein